MEDDDEKASVVYRRVADSRMRRMQQPNREGTRGRGGLEWIQRPWFWRIRSGGRPMGPGGVGPEHMGIAEQLRTDYADKY